MHHIYRLLIWRSAFTNDSSLHLAYYHRIPHYLAWALRSIFRRHPFFFMLGIWTAVDTVGSFSLMTLERGVDGSELGRFDNCLWNLMVDQARIGYGDMVPLTHLGRVTIIMCIFAAVVLLSSLVTVVQQSVALNKAETALYRKMYVQTMSNSLSRPAAVLLQRWWRLVQARRLQNSVRQDLLVRFHRCLRMFAIARRSATTLKDLTFREDLEKSAPSLMRRMHAAVQRLEMVTMVKDEVTDM